MDAYDKLLRKIRRQHAAIEDPQAAAAALAMVWRSMQGISQGLALVGKNQGAIAALGDCEGDDCDPPAQPPQMEPPP